MSDDDVLVVTIPANMKIEKCVRELAIDDNNHTEDTRNNQDNIVYFDSKQETKKYHLTYNWLLDCIPINED